MKINDMIFKNDVQAENQTSEKFKIYESENCKKRVLFLGNSITLHEKAPHIGWNRNCGMAASCAEKDYVHIVLRYLREKYGEIGYCVANVGEWERNYWEEDRVQQWKAAKDFRADIVVLRIGENIRKDCFEEYPLKGYLRDFIKYFITDETKVVITDTFWEHGYICDCLKAVAEEIHAEFVSIADLGYKDENKALGLFEHAGVAGHPGDLGMERIAERIIEKLEKLD